MVISYPVHRMQKKLHSEKTNISQLMHNLFFALTISSQQYIFLSCP